jgi:hypothetical protein
MVGLSNSMKIFHCTLFLVILTGCSVFSTWCVIMCWVYPVTTMLKCFVAGVIGVCTVVINNKPMPCHGLQHTQFGDIQAPISYVSFQLFVSVFTCGLCDNTVLLCRDSM